MLASGGPPAAAFEALFDRGKVNIALNPRIMALGEKTGGLLCMCERVFCECDGVEGFPEGITKMADVF